MSLKTVQRLLAAVICGFVLATCYISVLIFERQAALNQVSRYNTAWTVGQMLSEFLRLERVLASYAISEAGIDFEDVQLRFDIVLSRLETFEQGPSVDGGPIRSLRHFIRSQPANEEAIRLLRERMKAVDALILADGPAFDVAAALRILEPLDAVVAELGSRASAYGTARADEDRRELERLHLIFSGLAGGLILCGIVLIILLLRQNRLLGQAHKSLSTTAAELKDTHDTLTLQNQRFNAALNNMSQALCTCDASGRLVVFNERFADLLGSSSAVQAGSVLAELLQPKRESPSPTALVALYRRQLPLIREHRKSTFTLDLPDGRSYAVSHEPLADGGWLATYADVTVRRRAEARILHMAHHDALTDLPNRVLLREWLEERWAQKHSEDESVSILALDLDGFKEVNDTLGHHLGDEVLKSVASRLRACAPAIESVARLGGDEFAILLPRTYSEDESLATAKQVLKSVTEPYLVSGHEIVLGASIGIAHESLSSCDPVELLKHADLAMYQAKAEGKARIIQFSPNMEARLHARKSLEADLREAVEQEDMVVHYQPLLNTQTREIEGFEALLRWKRRDLEYVSPAEFIPVAEEIGLIDRLGEWVLRQACRDAALWPPEISVAVNLSPLQFRSGNIVRTVLKVLTETGLAARRLEIEITESVLLEASEVTLSTLHQLKQLGVRIALDDFGTGYSSLSYLSSFPFDKIKIDRSFIRDLTTRADASAVVELVVDLGRKLNIVTTAEGVETEAQMACLQKIGCDQVQGFLFARPKLLAELQFGHNRTENDLIDPISQTP